MTGIVGWDIGGVNVKASWLAMEQGRAQQVRVTSRPFEIWRDKNRLPEVLRLAFAEIAPDMPPQAMAVTMSAELSDVFAKKREGVLFVLECIGSSFPDLKSYVLNVSGEFVLLDEARTRPLEFAAANWVASAQWAARKYPNCLLVDVGSTTTDILPILNGEVRVSGRTDTERLLSGELVYTGALRTNLAAIVQSVPVFGRPCPVASEYFSVSGDIHLILGHLQPEDYTCTTPDNRPPTVDSARARLARLVCADTEILSEPEIDALARHIHGQQVLQICVGLEQVTARIPELRNHPVLVHGAGVFLGRAAAESLGLKIEDMAGDFSREESTALPCVCIAHLLAAQMKEAP
jgi:probable H4MPT-linked C1 transfer pathway protein